MTESLEVSDTLNDTRRLARTADKYDDGYRGVLRLLGHGAVRLADIILTLGGWLLAAVIWALGVIWFILRTATKIMWRISRPRARRQVVAATA